MKTPHFYKAYSRIGLQNAPHRMDSLNVGVEEGSSAIASEDFLKQFPKRRIDEYRFTSPEKIKAEIFNQTFLREMLEFEKLITGTLSISETKVVLGGEHSVSFASILNSFKRHDPKKIGYIHFDSHPDANLWSESPTHNWHGMYLRPFLTKFDLPEIEELVPNKLDPHNVLYIGNLDQDFGERQMIESLGIRNINLEIAKTKRLEVPALIEEILGRVEFLHVNFDIDVFDRTVAPATSIPTQGGFFEEDIFLIIGMLKRFPQFALDLTEVNPQKEGGEETVKLAQKVLSAILS